MTILSFTGIDDSTDVDRLIREISKYRNSGGCIELDFGVLFFPEKQGMPRNPGYFKRLEVVRQFYSTAHLCGKSIFNSILETDHHSTSIILEELKTFPCIQLNINARSRVFDTNDVHSIYDRVCYDRYESKTVLQLHSKSEKDIFSYLDKSEKKYGPGDVHNRIQILLDESRGKGITRNDWKVPERLKDYRIRIAGGINADNISDTYKRFTDANQRSPYVIDMESSIRTDDQFDIDKVMQVINTESLQFIYL
jgi:hypothetical protein